MSDRSETSETGRTADVILAEYKAAHDAKERLLTEVQELNAEIGQLNRSRDATVARLQIAIKLRARLKEEYARASGGMDASKATWHRVEEELDQARGRLISAVCGPNPLPVDHPIALQRLEEWRDAYNRMRAVMAARIAQKCKDAA